MAKATATCTCTTCGREFNIARTCHNRREANSWESWASGYYTECSGCYDTRIQHERDEANATAKAAAEEAGFPELTGSEKQVAWANGIRQKAYNKLMSEAGGVQEPDTFQRFVAWIVNTHTKASWWIDTGREVVKYGVHGIPTELQNLFLAQDEKPEEKEIRQVAQQETTVEPENKFHDGRVEIAVSDNTVSAKYPKDDDFRVLAKHLGYTWDADKGAWMKRIGVTTGSAQERAAELGSRLLNAGFAVCIADPEIRLAAIEGRYEAQHMRWITKRANGEYDGWFCVSLIYGDGMYEKAKAIHGARYDKPDVVVPASEYAAVEDFAALYDYRLSPGAQEIIQRQKASIIIVAPAPAKKAVYHEADLAAILESSVDVLDDLKDN